ncbi:putative aldo keto reductase [Lyophyllum shimeji]|uniref:Aldo keto reductase n=1 Tax=Lyophyllum shimeji TaxID=47721 RepID=A0A9P3Q161_LYOSH|nr:putative aldo keto reductase [Lyophyllum shimeji]
MPPTSVSSTIKLPSGHLMPILGLGTYQNSDTFQACEAALVQGYRHIDTAQAYRNEDVVGAAVKASGVPRDSVFISEAAASKLSDGEKTVDCVQQSLTKLDLGYIDLYLIHSPHGGKAVRVRTYETLLELCGPDKVLRDVGVSNFGVEHLEDLREAGLPTPTVNQIELHPFCQQKDIVDYCRKHGIIIQAYSPLARGRFTHPLVQEVCKAHKKSPAQVFVRWSIERGFVPLPKSAKPERIKENADVFDFELSQDDLDKLNSLDRGIRGAVSWNPVDVD